jgi:NAD(P) transhydrogenase subunit alpha
VANNLYVPRETREHERRVACVPDTVTRLTGAGLHVTVEKGAGVAAGYPDADYEAAGAAIADRAAISAADVVLAVQPLPVDDAAKLADGSVVISFLQPAAEPELMELYASRKVSAFSLDRLPRISRAQSMDALSSQAVVAG